MSRGLLPAISAITFVTTTAAYLFWKKITKPEIQLIDRLTIKKIIIQLRKRAYSTLREISFIVNNIRTLQGDLDAKKISQIFMRDGGSGQKKLHAIESLVLQQMNINRKQFENSCDIYYQNDIQIKILLETFRKDLNLALQGVIQTYQGPLPRFTSEKVLKIQQQIIRRTCCKNVGRMEIIYKKYSQDLQNMQCLKLEAQIQEYLQLQGVTHQKQPNQKIFMSILEYNYRTDYEFKEELEQLELNMEMFMIEMKNKGKLKRKNCQNEEKIQGQCEIKFEQS